MNYPYGSTGHNNDISRMDYWNLINLLSTQLTPEIRRLVLERLTEINNQMIRLGSSVSGSYVDIPTDLARSGFINSRKKDLNETQHPAVYSRNDGTSPMSLNLPVNPRPISSTSGTDSFGQMGGTGSGVMGNPYGLTGLNASPNTVGFNPANPFVNMSTNPVSRPQPGPEFKFSIDEPREFDIDELIGEEDSEEDLDDKLARISALRHKIIRDKKQRKKAKEKTKN